MILLVSATTGSDDAGIAAAPAMTELVIARRVMCVAMIRGPPVASVMVRGRHGCTRGGLSVCALKVRRTRAAKCTPACGCVQHEKTRKCPVCSHFLNSCGLNPRIAHAGPPRALLA